MTDSPKEAQIGVQFTRWTNGADRPPLPRFAVSEDTEKILAWDRATYGNDSLKLTAADFRAMIERPADCLNNVAVSADDAAYMMYCVPPSHKQAYVTSLGGESELAMDSLVQWILSVSRACLVPCRTHLPRGDSDDDRLKVDRFTRNGFKRVGPGDFTKEAPEMKMDPGEINRLDEYEAVPHTW